MTRLLFNKTHIHYLPPTGEIICIETTIVPGVIGVPGSKVLSLPPNRAIVDPYRHKVLSGEIVDKSEAEQRVAKQPQVVDVQNAVQHELSLTDRYMLPDYPVSQEVRDEWSIYRQTLRDLSKSYAEASEMIEAWPLIRPDGSDAIPLLRTRVA